jgi:carboxylesterase type B
MNAKQMTNSTVAQSLFEILGQVGSVQDEDCLTLNIWTKPQAGDKAKAVMIWFYGGGKLNFQGSIVLINLLTLISIQLWKFSFALI